MVCSLKTRGVNENKVKTKKIGGTNNENGKI